MSILVMTIFMNNCSPLQHVHVLSISETSKEINTNVRKYKYALKPVVLFKIKRTKMMVIQFLLYKCRIEKK